MNKTLTTMVAAATLCMVSQASAAPITLTAGENVGTGITGLFGAITYTTTASFGFDGFPNQLENGFAQGNTNGIGVNASPNPGIANTPADAMFRNVLDSRVNGVTVVGAWEMLTVTFSEVVSLTDFILGKMDANDDFEYSFDGVNFTPFTSDYSEGEALPATLTQSEQTFAVAPAKYITTFSIRAVGSFANDDDDFALKSMNVSAVPLPATGLMLLAGLGGIAALRRRKKA